MNKDEAMTRKVAVLFTFICFIDDEWLRRRVVQYNKHCVWLLII